MSHRGQIMEDRQNGLACDLARRVIARTVPEELVLFDAAGGLYAGSERRRARNRSRGDKLLGFGFSDAATLLSPAVMLVARAVVERLAGDAGDAVASGSGRMLKKAGRRLSRRFRGAARRRADGDPGNPELAVSADQMDPLRALAVDGFRKQGLPDDQARLLADSLMAELREKI